MNRKIYKVVYLLFSCFIFLNITGCATTMLWSKDNKLESKALSFTEELFSPGIYSCNVNQSEEKYLYIPYYGGYVRKSFPPYKKGVVIIPSGENVNKFVQEIQEFESLPHNKDAVDKIITTLKKQFFLDVTNSTQYQLDYTLVRNHVNDKKNKELEHIEVSNAKITNIIFEEKTIDELQNMSCVALVQKRQTSATSNPLYIDIVLKYSSKYHNEYKVQNSFVRTVATPISVGIDIATSPIQLTLALIGVLFWTIVGPPV